MLASQAHSDKIFSRSKFMKHPVGKTKNGIPVYVDLIHSKAAKHISQQPHLLGLVKEVLASTNATKPSITIEQDMGRNIGYDFVVKTNDKDTVFYAQVLRSNNFMPYIKNGSPASTNYLTLILEKRKDDSYELTNAWIGRLSPPCPGSENESADSKDFWAEHAVVLGTQHLQLKTVTKECPY